MTCRYNTNATHLVGIFNGGRVQKRQVHEPASLYSRHDARGPTGSVAVCTCTLLHAAFAPLHPSFSHTQTLQAHLLLPNQAGAAAAAPTPASMTARPAASQPVGSPSSGGTPAAAVVLRSTYALAMSSPGNLVAVGTTESHIRLLDPRSGQKLMKLKVGELAWHDIGSTWPSHYALPKCYHCHIFC